MKNLIIAISCLLAGMNSVYATNDSIPIPEVIQLAKVVKLNGNAKFWIVYKTPFDLINLEKEGFTILKTKVKLIRNNDFWIDVWQSSLQMAVGYIVANKDKGTQGVLIPAANQPPSQQLGGNKFIYKQY